MSTKYVSIDTLSRKKKDLIGGGLIGMSLFIGFLMYLSPSNLKVPVFIAIIALAIFFVTGVAICLHGRITTERYHSIIQGIILLMSIIPLWIGFDPMEKHCRANFFFLSGDLPCRVGFGFGGILLILIFILSFTALGKKK